MRDHCHPISRALASGLPSPEQSMLWFEDRQQIPGFEAAQYRERRPVLPGTEAGPTGKRGGLYRERRRKYPSKWPN